MLFFYEVSVLVLKSGKFLLTLIFLPHISQVATPGSISVPGMPISCSDSCGDQFSSLKDIYMVKGGWLECMKAMEPRA